VEKIENILEEIKVLSKVTSLLELTLLDIDVWPILKRDVYVDGIRKIRGKKGTSKRVKLLLIRKLIDGVASFTLWIFSKRKHQGLILSYSTFNRSMVNGLWTDPYTEYFTRIENGWQRLEVAQRGIRKKPTVNSVKVPNSLFLLCKLLSPLVRLAVVNIYPKEVKVIKSISPRTINSIIDIFLYGLFWKQVLKWRKIQKVGLVGWNQNISVGLNYAAVSLNIPVFEVVHGKVWKGKPMSTGFKHYFNCLPNELIVSDEIQGRIVTDSNAHLKARIQLNIYKLLIDNDSGYDIASREALKNLTGKQQFLTVCLGHDDLPLHLVRAFKSLSGYKVLLRPHPGFGNIGEYKNFQNIQELLKSKEVRIVDVSTISLNSMLGSTKYLFAFGSTTLIDAVSADVPAILMDEIYEIQFKDYIDAGLIFVLKREDSLKSILDKLA